MSDPVHSSRDPHASGSHFQPSLSVVLIIVVLFVGATFLMVRATSPSTGATTTNSTLASGSTTTTSPHAPLAKSKVRVQVANSTLTAGLAAHYTQILTTQDWDVLPAGNATAIPATIVYFNPGFRNDALEIASTIKVSASSVKPLNGAVPIAGSPTDDVIVVLGPNSAIG
ncbi:MAG TPA: LytR C-terminal domain-containing protein [Acidimicrobiales bacterium]|nr:LytR C-terminal domain-containing protein [Acidimicrobiales bacterium]